jgi:hypothetical protein
MKRILSVCVGAARDDYAVEAQVLDQRVQVSRVGVDGNWERALQLLRASDGQVAAIGLGGLWRPRDRRLQAAREAVRVSRFADGRRVRPMLARRALAALEAHLNKTGATLEGRRALLPCAAVAAPLAETLAAFGCSIVAGDLLFTLGLHLPLRQGLAVRAASQLLAWLPDRGSSAPKGAAERWQALAADADVLAVPQPGVLAAIGVAPEGKILVVEAAEAGALAALRQAGALAVISAGPDVGGRCLEADAVEAVLLALSEKPEAEIAVDDLEAAAARIPLRPALR